MDSRVYKNIRIRMKNILLQNSTAISLIKFTIPLNAKDEIYR